MNLMKNCLSSNVYLFPFAPRTTLVGGVGGLEGGSGSTISRCKGRNFKLSSGSCAVMLLIVRRLDIRFSLLDCLIDDEIGGGDPGSFFTTTPRRDGGGTCDLDTTRFEFDVFASVDLVPVGGVCGGLKGEGFLTVLTGKSGGETSLSIRCLWSR